MQFLFSNKLSDASLSRTLADTGRLPLFPHRGEAGGKQKRPQVVACDPSKSKGETRATNADVEYHRFGGCPSECWGSGKAWGCGSNIIEDHVAYLAKSAEGCFAQKTCDGKPYLDYATRRAKLRRERENRVAPLGMTERGERSAPQPHPGCKQRAFLLRRAGRRRPLLKQEGPKTQVRRSYQFSVVSIKFRRRETRDPGTRPVPGAPDPKRRELKSRKTQERTASR